MDADTRMPWPSRWFDTVDPGDVSACRALWACVLASCLKGAIADACQRADRGNFMGQGGAVSAHWIGSRDFHMVCALAGLDGIFVLDQVEAALALKGAALDRMDSQLGLVGARSSINRTEAA